MRDIAFGTILVVDRKLPQRSLHHPEGNRRNDQRIGVRPQCPACLTRRDLLKITAAVSFVPFLPRAAAAQALAYTPSLVDERLAAGDTVFLDFKASWCSDCAAQERVIDALNAENPA